jgi:ADP-ribosyl-[dinitrogen reductase] hydrolase
MSDAVDETVEALALAEKLERFRYLMPSVPALLADKVRSGTPSAEDEEEAEAPDPIALARQAALRSPVWPRLDPAEARDRALGCVMGLAIGDAAGAAAVFKARGSFPPREEAIAGAPVWAPGEWTGGTSMALCLADSLLATGEVDQQDFMERLRRWLTDGENSVKDKCFDIGITTRAAVESFAAGGPAAAGHSEADSADSGSLVRLAPLAVFYRSAPEQAEAAALMQSRTTHAAMECIDACKLFAAILVDALAGADKAAAMRPRVMNLEPRLLFINGGEWREKSRAEIGSSGYVVHTLEAALWSVWQTENFHDAVLTAANLGDAAADIAAVAGQLAGALYGVSAIPKEWLDKLAWSDRIETLAIALTDRRVTRRADRR